MPQPPIFVTRPFLPPIEDLLPWLEGIWERRILTNNGPLVQQLEAQITELLQVPYLSLMNNGTSALIAALATLPKKSQVITTPFTFAASTHAITMVGLQPIFADIDPDYFCLDPDAVEQAITENTSAILAVHTYGTACHVDALSEIAARHNIKLIYDAAHAFGVTYKNKSLLSYGDMATLSFHATKSFNTFEGGAVVTASAAEAATIELIRNFGIQGEAEIPTVGFNGKMSELHAAVGLAQLPYFSKIREMRRQVHSWYMSTLTDISQISMRKLQPETKSNYTYFPILIDRESPKTRNQVLQELQQAGIMTRRYFFPLTSSLPSYSELPSARSDNLPVANDIGNRVLCLPIYPELSEGDLKQVLSALKHCFATPGRY